MGVWKSSGPAAMAFDFSFVLPFAPTPAADEIVAFPEIAPSAFIPQN